MKSTPVLYLFLNSLCAILQYIYVLCAGDTTSTVGPAGPGRTNQQRAGWLGADTAAHVAHMQSEYVNVEHAQQVVMGRPGQYIYTCPRVPGLLKREPFVHTTLVHLYFARNNIMLNCRYFMPFTFRYHTRKPQTGTSTKPSQEAERVELVTGGDNPSVERRSRAHQPTCNCCEGDPNWRGTPTNV